MKQYLLLLSFLLSTAWLPAQSLLHEAIQMRGFFTMPDSADPDRKLIFEESQLDGTARDFLQQYLPQNAKMTTFTINQAFANNPFLRIKVTSNDRLAPSRGEMSSFSQNNAPATQYGFSVAGFADGLARFLVKRTKLELSQAFFDDFKKHIQKDVLLGHFCPFTRDRLLYIDTDVYQLTDYLEGLRESFVTDMTALPGSMESYLRSPELCDSCAERVIGKVSIDFLHLSQQMVDGEKPVDMIDYLASPGSEIQSASPQESKLFNMAGGLRFLNLVSKSMINPESKDSLMSWYTSRDIREALKDPVVLRIYLGLLWQKGAEVAFVDKNGEKVVSLRELMNGANKTAETVQQWRKSIESLGEATHSIQRSIKAGSTTPSSGSDDFFRYAQSLTSFLQSANGAGRLLLSRETDLIPQDYIFLMQQCNSLYFNVRQRNYTGAIGNVVFCLNLLNESKNLPVKDKAKAKAAITEMLRYANFVASIAEANSPDEMEHAIELFALPPGSSSMKKQSNRFSVALNAYAGFALGREYLDYDTHYKKIRALSAPLGLSCSYGLGKFGSVGLFVPVIDVGAVTAYRLDDSAAQNLPELTWANIFAPGLYLVYDLPRKWPIAFSYGAQVGPALRKVTEAGVEINKSGWRQGFAVSVDIPITYLYLGKGKK